MNLEIDLRTHARRGAAGAATAHPAEPDIHLAKRSRPREGVSLFVRRVVKQAAVIQKVGGDCSTLRKLARKVGHAFPDCLAGKGGTSGRLCEAFLTRRIRAIPARHCDFLSANL